MSKNKNTTETVVEAKTVAKSAVPTLTRPVDVVVRPEGKILQILQLGNYRLRMRRNDAIGTWTLGEQYVITAKGGKGNTFFEPERVVETCKTEDKARIAFLRKIHAISSELVSRL